MRKFALLIGVENYRDQRISRLRFASADVNGLDERLRDRCAFDRTMVLAGEGQHSPDLIHIVEALADFSGELQADDLFLFFFSGHGIEVGGRSYLLTQDTPQALPQHASLSLELLRETFSRISAGTRILILDACRNDPEAGKGDASNLMGSVISKDIQAVLQAAAAPKSTTALLSACQAGQRAYEWDGKGHGVFTHYLLEGIDGAAWESGHLSFRDLASYTATRVEQWCTNTIGNRRPQQPWYEQYGEPRDVLLAAVPEGCLPGVQETNRKKAHPETPSGSGPLPVDVYRVLPKDLAILVEGILKTAPRDAPVGGLIVSTGDNNPTLIHWGPCSAGLAKRVYVLVKACGFVVDIVHEPAELHTRGVVTGSCGAG